MEFLPPQRSGSSAIAKHLPLKWECKPTQIVVVRYWEALESADVTWSVCVKLIFVVHDRDVEVGRALLWSK